MRLVGVVGLFVLACGSGQPAGYSEPGGAVDAGGGGDAVVALSGAGGRRLMTSGSGGRLGVAGGSGGAEMATDAGPTDSGQPTPKDDQWVISSGGEPGGAGGVTGTGGAPTSAGGAPSQDAGPVMRHCQDSPDEWCGPADCMPGDSSCGVCLDARHCSVPPGYAPICVPPPPIGPQLWTCGIRKL